MHAATLLLELGCVILGLGVVAALAARVGISPIPLYLIAGLAFNLFGEAAAAVVGVRTPTPSRLGAAPQLVASGAPFERRAEARDREVGVDRHPELGRHRDEACVDRRA